MFRRAQINSGAGAVPISLASAGGSKLVRAQLALSANGTIDFQDGSSNSLNGGPIPLAAGQPFSVGYTDQDDAFQNPIFLTGGSGGDAFPFTGAAIDWDFANGRYAPALGLTTTRASVAYEDDLSGNWTQFAANVARITNKGLLVEEARTNSIRNNSMQGAIVGTPGTLPTNWAPNASNQGTIVANVVAIGTVNGIDYIDIRMVGTSAASGFYQVFFDMTVAAADTQTWSNSLFCSVSAGSLTNVSAIQLGQVTYTSGSGFIASYVIPINPPIGTSPQRFAQVQQISGATIAFDRPVLSVNFAGAAAIDVTLRIGWPQLELGAFATSPIRTTAAAVTRAADVVTVTSPPAFGTAYTMFAAGTPLAPNASPNNQDILQIDDGTNNNYVLLRRRLTTFDPRFVWTVASTVTQVTGSINWQQGVAGKMAGAGQANDQALFFNGGFIGTANAAGNPAGLSTVMIGSLQGSGGGDNWDGYITRVAVWPNQRLPNATLQSITSPGPANANGLNLVIAGAGTCTGYVDYMLAGGN